MKAKSTPLVRPRITYPALVGKVIQYHRKAKDVDQSVIAAALGITQPAYSRLELGHSVFSITQLRRVARCLTLAPGYLIDEAEQYAKQLEREGVELTEEKAIAPGAVLVGLGLLAALLAAQ